MRRVERPLGVERKSPGRRFTSKKDLEEVMSKGHVKRYPPPPLRYGGGSISGAMIITTMI